MKYFESYTNNNKLQINDTYQNLYLSRKIPISVGTGNIGFNNGEFIAAIGNGTNSVNGCSINNGGSCSYKYDGGPQAYIYVFSRLPSQGSRNGLQIFNKDGALIFDSNTKQARVLGSGGIGVHAARPVLAIACGGNTTSADAIYDRSLQTWETTGTRYEWRTEIETVWEDQKKTRFEWVDVPYTEWETYTYTVNEPTVETYRKWDPALKAYVNDTRVVMKPVEKKGTRLVHKTRRELKQVEYTERVQVSKPVTKQVPVKYTTYWKKTVIKRTQREYLYNLCLIGGTAQNYQYNYKENQESKDYLNTKDVDYTGMFIGNAPPGWYTGNKLEQSHGTIQAYSCVILDVSNL